MRRSEGRVNEGRKWGERSRRNNLALRWRNFFRYNARDTLYKSSREYETERQYFYMPFPKQTGCTSLPAFGVLAFSYCIHPTPLSQSWMLQTAHP